MRTVGRLRVVVAVCAAALVCAGGSAAGRVNTPTVQKVTIAGAGGVQLACEFVLPAGSMPNGGWPGLLLFPGLGDTPAGGTDFAAAGFASVSCDERGTGSSGGSFDLAGPTSAQDAQAIFDWLAARPEVSDTKIGAYGEDLGGAEVWNAAVAGVPFKAIVPADTWSSLDRALKPTGAVSASLLQLFKAEGPTAWDTASGIAARSYRGRLHGLTVPTLIIHDRQNFLIDLSQATAAYRLLAGPKRLIVTWSGALPPEPQVTAFFRHYLADGPPTPTGVELQHENPDAKSTTYRALPRTRSVSVNLPGSSLKRSVRLPGGPFETFGAGSVTVRYADASWKQLVAKVWTSNGTLVTEGAVPVRKQDGVVKIPLLDEVLFLPRGKRLVVSLSSHDAEFGGSAGGTTAIHRVTLKLSFLQRAVSR